MTTGLSDDVLTAAQSGDSAALGRIYNDFAPKVVGYFIARGADDPEGLSQEVFLSVLTQLNTVTNGMQGLRTFLFSVAHARYVDDVRKRSRSPRQSPYDPASDGRISASAEDQAMNAAGGAAVALLKELAEAQREVLTLRIVADLPLAEVAGVMGQSVGSVKQLQRRGLARLKELLGEEDSRHDGH